MARAEIAQRLRAAGAAGADRLLPAVRWVTRKEPDAAIDVEHSKFGGAPDLPRNTAWPTVTVTGTGGERRPLQFFAQLDLGRASEAAPGPLGLPADGCLSFFADFDVEKRPADLPGSPMVLYAPSDCEFIRYSLHLVPLPTAELAALGIWTWPREVAADAFEREYDAHLDELMHERYRRTARHQLGGHSRGAAAGVPAGDNATVVFQFDSDDSLEIAWGSAGSNSALQWAVRPAELAGGRWVQCQVTFTS